MHTESKVNIGKDYLQEINLFCQRTTKKTYIPVNFPDKRQHNIIHLMT